MMDMLLGAGVPLTDQQVIEEFERFGWIVRTDQGKILPGPKDGLTEEEAKEGEWW